MNDLVKRLRAAKKATDPWDAWHLSNKAADHIDELRKDLLPRNVKWLMNIFWREEMGETVDLNSRRHPVFYTVNIVHHYDGTIEFEIKDIDDDARSRDAVLHAFKRISGADHRIEALEKALRTLIKSCDTGVMMSSVGVGGMTVATNIKSSWVNNVEAWAVEEARAALEGKDGCIGWSTQSSMGRSSGSLSRLQPLTPGR
jgi:hypothetical protein